MKKLEISPDFTNEDIQKIRWYNHELRQTMSSEEYDKYFNAKVKEGKRKLEEIRAKSIHNA
jgi:hypothetical protein